MYRRVFMVRTPSHELRALRSIARGMAGLAILISFGLSGCATEQQTRLQAEDEPQPVKYEVKTIGDVTSVGEAEPIPVGGIGLVINLADTGGDCPPGEYRRMLIEQLQKDGVRNWKEILSSKSTSLVILNALIPPGSRKGEKIDVQVSLPEGSKTTSLRGGILYPCMLYSFDTTQHLTGNTDQPDRGLKGPKLLRAEGPVQIGMGDAEEKARLRQGVIWGGGALVVDRSFKLFLNEDQKYARMAALVADRINESFHGPFHGPLGGEVAIAKDNTQVLLTVPQQYSHNLQRYLRVIRLIPLKNESADSRHRDGEGGPGKESYRQRLERELHDPAYTVTTALRLEAMGQNSIAILKTGLKSEHALVRFCSAEALAYLGSPSSAIELAHLVQEQPLLRSYCLTALASLQESVSRIELRKLLAVNNAEVRYGAFRSLRALDEHDESIAGELVNDSFWLHKAAVDSDSMVHVTSTRRAEIVLFGNEASLIAPFAFNSGPFTVTAAAGDDHCVISHCSAVNGVSHQICSLKVEDVIRMLSKMGSLYPEVVDVLHQANQCHCLSCPFQVDALPQAISVKALARAGFRSKGRDVEIEDELGTDQEIQKASPDLGVTPTIFQKGPEKKAAPKPDSPDADQAERNAGSPNEKP